MNPTVDRKFSFAAAGRRSCMGLTACKQRKCPQDLTRAGAHGNGAERSPLGTAPNTQPALFRMRRSTSLSSPAAMSISIRQVKSPSGGMRNIDQGDWVQKGTVLAVVRQQDYLDKVQQAKAQLARAQAEYDKAKLTFDRVSALYASQSATKPDYDSAQAQLASTTASVSGAQAQVSEANVALAYCELRAPFSGWVVKRNVDLGQLVGPATNGFTLADTQSVKAVFGVPDTSISRVRLGQHLAISTDALPQQFAGRVSAISPRLIPRAASSR